MELTRYRRSVVPKFIAVMFAAMWLTGCNFVYTVSPLIDDSTPIDQRLLGTVVAAYDSNAGHFKKPSPHHSLVIINGPENNILAAGSVGSLGFDDDADRHCGVFGFRAGLFVPEPYTGGWAIGELDLKRTHSCYDSSETFMTDTILGEIKESGLDSVDNVYAPFFYKVMSIDGFVKEVGKLRADLNLNDLFSFYEIEESTAGIVLMVFAGALSSEMQGQLLDGLSTRKLDEHEFLVTDNAHAIKEAMFKFIRGSDTRLYDAVVDSRGWFDSLGLAYVLISPDDK